MPGIRLTDQERQAIAEAMPSRAEGGVSRIARESGLSRVYLWALLRGAKNPLPETLDRLLPVLGLQRITRPRRTITEVSQIVPKR